MIQSDEGLKRLFFYAQTQAEKTKYARELILHMVLVAATVHIDVMDGGNGVRFNVSLYYLIVNEAISIIENFRDAGVQNEPLLVLIENKLGGLKL